MNWLIFYWDQSNCRIFKNDHHGMMKNQKLRQWCSIIFHFLDHHVVHILHRRSRFPILYYFQQYRAWMARRSIQDECYFLFVVLVSFQSHNLHIRPKSPIHTVNNMTSFWVLSRSNRYKGRQTRSGTDQLPTKLHAVSYLWSLYHYFVHRLDFPPKTLYLCNIW